RLAATRPPPPRAPRAPPRTSPPPPAATRRARARIGRAASRSGHRPDGGPRDPLRHGRSGAGEDDAGRHVPHGRGRAGSALDWARTVPRTLRRGGSLPPCPGGLGAVVSGTRRPGDRGDPAAPGAHLAGTDARARQSCGAAVPPAPCAGHHPGAHAAGAGGGPQRADRGPTTRAGARRPALERLFHHGRAGGTGATTRTSPAPGTGDVSSPRCAAAGPSAADGPARAAHARTVYRTTADVVPGSASGGLPGGALPGHPTPGWAGALGASAHRGQSAVHGPGGGGLGAPRLARPGGQALEPAGGAGRLSHHCA